MSDLLRVLSSFSAASFSHLIPSLDKALITTADLLTLAPQDIAKRAQIPPTEVAKLVNAISSELDSENARLTNNPLMSTSAATEQVVAVSTLDPELDSALGGAIRPGYVTEITGESGVGKTQFLLTLLLAAQLNRPAGLGKSALYISTEAVLSTARLKQLLTSHPKLSGLSDQEKPSLDRILSIQASDLESQDHILRYQVPVVIKRRNIGLVVVDSIAANYRAEFEKTDKVSQARSAPNMDERGKSAETMRAGQTMAERKAQLVQLGAFLRQLAQNEHVAVVVANQIADRFQPMQAPMLSHPATPGISPDPLTLDHQQRWFTGWGDLPSYTPGHTSLKTPSLGLIWTNQISTRIALVKETSAVGESNRRRRWLRVAFSSCTAASADAGIEYDIHAKGIRAIQATSTQPK